MNTTTFISEQEFDEVWGAHCKPDGELFELDDVRDLPVNTVWTVVESDDGEDWIGLPGFHLVNRVGYVVTTKPWDNEMLEAMWFERLGEDGDEQDEDDES